MTTAMLNPAGPAQADFPAETLGLASVAPEQAGLSSSGLQAVDRFYDARVRDGRMAGIVYAVARGGKLVHAHATGHADIAAGRPMAFDTVFRLYSMTKPVTAVALMILHEEGRFDLGDPVSQYLPEFGGMRVLHADAATADDVEDAGREMTIRDVLTHTAGFGLGFDMSGLGEKLLAETVVYVPGETLADQMAKVSRVPLCTQPGAVWNYSLSPDLQARLVEVISGQTFGAFVQEHIFDPLGMTDTAFTPRPDMIERLANVYWMGPEGLTRWCAASMPPELPGIPWPAPLGRLDDNLTFERGSFGLYSTLGDYLKFALMLAAGGAHGGGRILSEDTVRLMTRDHLDGTPMIWPIEGLGFGLGLAMVKDPEAAKFAGPPGTFFWGGAAATTFWVDPENDLVVVALTQHLFVPGVDPELLHAEMHDHIYPTLIEAGVR